MQTPTPEEGGIIKGAWFDTVNSPMHFFIDSAYTSKSENTDFVAENIHGDRWYIQTSEFVPIEYDDKCYQEDKELLNILIEANKQLK